MNVTIIRLDSCNKDYYIKKSYNCIQISTILKVKLKRENPVIILYKQAKNIYEKKLKKGVDKLFQKV